MSGAAPGIWAMGALVILLAPLTVGLAVTAVPEPGAAVQRQARWSDWLALLKRPNVLRVFATDTLMGLAIGLQGALFFFYFERAKGMTRSQAELLIIAYFLAAVAGAALWTPLAKRFGKAGGVIAAGVVVTLAQGVLVAVPAGSFALLAAAVILSGLPYSAAPFLLRAAMADIGDEERLATGQDHTGLLYALAASAAKIGAALTGGALVVLGALGFSGSDPAASSAAGETALRWIYLAGPAVLALLAALPMVGYPLTAARHAEIRKALDAQS
ncbi:MAG: transporter [Caulobacteraceae bacterium]|nr:transporter [Caulobacteraceae bacterium]